MADVFANIVALGRTDADRALLRRALGELDAHHQLASKITSKPNLAVIMSEFVTRLRDAFGTLSAIRGQAVLDIACGSSSSRSPLTGLQTSEFEPWMCRLLWELGAHPVGLDIGDIAGEAFEHHRVDLGVPSALDFLASGSFDAIHESRLFGSPEFRSAHGPATERIRREIHRQERRLLRSGGIIIHSDGRPDPREAGHPGGAGRPGNGGLGAPRNDS
jgi:SAM-dependent methyltransferase